MSGTTDINMEDSGKTQDENIEEIENDNIENDIIEDLLSENVEALNDSHTEPTATNAAENNKSRQNSRLPLARVKQIMKFDPDCSIISKDGLLLLSKATEMFIEYLGKESFKHTISNKKKTVSKRDVETAIECAPNLCFLDGALEWE